MTLRFTTTQQSARTAGVKAFVYGPPGMGKTMLCATLPNPIILSAESGMLSLSKANIERVFGVNTPGITYDIPVIEISTFAELEEAYLWCTQAHEAKQFQTYGLDSLTEIAEIVLSNAKRTVKDPRQAYGDLIERMTVKVRQFRDIPGKHVYMSAKMATYKDELTGISKYGISMPGAKLGPELPYLFDEVFRIGVNKDPQGQSFRFLQTQPDIQFEAKDRSGALAPMEPPHLGYIFAKILGA